MRRFSWYFQRFLLYFATLLFAMWFFGPYEDVEFTTEFDETRLADGVDAYLAKVEAGFDDIRDQSEKHVIWAGAAEVKTPVSVVYFHGFSASAHEIRPVPDDLAKALGANLVYTRFQGHGRDGDAMGDATVKGWMADAVEALAVGRAVGEQVILVTTSTGGTLAALALHAPELQGNVAGVVFVSPNFGVNNPAAALLTMPGVRVWGPVVAGATQSFEPLNAAQGAHWTTSYPTIAAVPMAAAVKEAVGLDYAQVRIPALFYYADVDEVVSAAKTDKIMEGWGGAVTRVTPALTDADDPMSHVIAGDIMSPAQTEFATQTMLDWAQGLK